jgi:hypothetical protein
MKMRIAICTETFRNSVQLCLLAIALGVWLSRRLDTIIMGTPADNVKIGCIGSNSIFRIS